MMRMGSRRPSTPLSSNNNNSASAMMFDDSLNFSDLGSLSDLIQDGDLHDFSETIEETGHLTPVKESTESIFAPTAISSLDSDNIEGAGEGERAAVGSHYSNPDLTHDHDHELYVPSYMASMVPVAQPNENDVLLGRGGRNNQWSGNEKLREMARAMSAAYSAAAKRSKPAIAMLLVNEVRALTPAGRFLKQEQAVGAWHEVEEEVAREKASQCLRDIVAAVTKGKDKSSGRLKTDGDDGSSFSQSNEASAMKLSASSPGIAFLRESASSAHVDSADGNAQWDISSMMKHRSLGNLRGAAAGSGKSAAARAGLAMLRGNTASNTSSNSNYTPSHIVSDSSFAVNLQGSTNAAARAGLAMLRQGNAGEFKSRASFSGNNSNIMQISAANLQDFANNNSSGGGGHNHQNHMQYGAEPDVDGGHAGGGDSACVIDRKRRFASAPNLGDISSFLAKRRRNQQLDGVGGGSAMQNATFTTQELDSLEPIQLEEYNQRSRQRMAPKAVSCMSLGVGKSASAITLGSVGYPRQHQQQVGGHQSTDPLLRRLQMLKSSSNQVNHVASSHANNVSFHNHTISEEDSQASMGNFTWNNNQHEEAQSRRPTNMFASFMQQPRTTSAPEHNCFTGMGTASGEDDDTALQRWIDRMAEEELS